MGEKVGKRREGDKGDRKGDGGGEGHDLDSKGMTPLGSLSTRPCVLLRTAPSAVCTLKI